MQPASGGFLPVRLEGELASRRQTDCRPPVNGPAEAFEAVSAIPSMSSPGTPATPCLDQCEFSHGLGLQRIAVWAIALSFNRRKFSHGLGLLCLYSPFVSGGYFRGLAVLPVRKSFRGFSTSACILFAFSGRLTERMTEAVASVKRRVRSVGTRTGAGPARPGGRVPRSRRRFRSAGLPAGI